MVGGSAAALLFHTLGIYIFTTASEWPGAAMTSSISFGAVVQVALKNKAEALANKRSEGLMCCWTTSAGAGGGELGSAEHVVRRVTVTAEIHQRRSQEAMTPHLAVCRAQKGDAAHGR